MPESWKCLNGSVRPYGPSRCCRGTPGRCDPDCPVSHRRYCGLSDPRTSRASRGFRPDGIMPGPETTGAPAIESPTAGASGTGRFAPGPTAPGAGATPTAHADRRPDGVYGAGRDRARRRPGPVGITLPRRVRPRPSRHPFRPPESGRSRPTLVTAPAPPDAKHPLCHNPRDGKNSLFRVQGPPRLSPSKWVVLSGVFSPSSIAVSAGAEVTIVFENQDEGVPHNVVVYAENACPGLRRHGHHGSRPAPPTPSPPRRHRAGMCWGAASRNCTAKGPSSSSRDGGESVAKRAAADLVPGTAVSIPRRRGAYTRRRRAAAVAGYRPPCRPEEPLQVP